MIAEAAKLMKQSSGSVSDVTGGYNPFASDSTFELERVECNV